MDETSTTDVDNPNKDDAGADSTTVSDPDTSTDNNQPADDNEGDNLDDSSKSTDDTTDSDDGDKKPADEDSSGEGDDTPTSDFDEDLDDWAEKRGFPKAESEEQKKSYQDLRDSQRDYTREQQAKKAQADVEKAAKDVKPDAVEDEEDYRDEAEIRADRVEKMIAEERALRLRSEYFRDNDLTSEESNAMGEILKEKVEKAPDDKKEAVYDYWTDPENIEDWHLLAKAKVSATTDTSAIEEKARKEERARIAKESQASGANKSAGKAPMNEDKDVIGDILSSDDDD